MNERANEPAYPVEVEYRNGAGELCDVQTGPTRGMARGLTIREHFAGLMMAAGISALTDDSAPVTPREMARCAVANADALIAALNQEQGK